MSIKMAVRIHVGESQRQSGADTELVSASGESRL
jgi:hypothetical protein